MVLDVANSFSEIIIHVAIIFFQIGNRHVDVNSPELDFDIKSNSTSTGVICQGCLEFDFETY